jgi:SAM-dependent methyltransferase
VTDPNEFTEPFARFYDARTRDTTVGDETFYREAATDADGPVLEAACGTGRLYLEFLRAGVDADGFDASPAMLDVLRERAADAGLDPSVWVADLRAPATDRRYDLVVVPYNSVVALTTVDDRLAALTAAHDLLRPGGRLLFDAYVPRQSVIADSFGEWRETTATTPDGETLRARTKTTVADEVTQTYRAERELLDENGDVLASETYVNAHLPPQQVELLARASPFDDWRATGGFDGEPLTDGAEVQVWELAKA